MKFDAIIILGGGINKDGTLLEITVSRLEKGIELFRKNTSAYVIVSGAYGFMLDYIPQKTEARIMKEYLEKEGLPKEKIILEEESKDTLGNAYFTKLNVLEPKKWYKVIIVTSDFHLERTKYIFKKVFGNKYKIEFITSSSDLTKQVIKRLETRERKVLKILKKWLKNVKIEDNKSINRLLYTIHPAYAKNPKVTKETLIKMIKNS